MPNSFPVFCIILIGNLRITKAIVIKNKYVRKSANPIISFYSANKVAEFDFTILTFTKSPILFLPFGKITDLLQSVLPIK